MFFQDKGPHATDWISFLLIGVFFVLGLLHYFGGFSIKSVFSSINASPTHQEKANIKVVIVNLVFLAVIALLALFFIRKDEAILTTDWLLYLQLILGIGVLLVAQRLASILHGFLTNTQHFFTQYSLLRSKFFQLSGLIMLPFLLLAIYSPDYNGQFIFVAVLVFGLVYALGVLKTLGYSNILSGQFKYHIIYYICGIEILPLFILYKQLI